MASWPLPTTGKAVFDHVAVLAAAGQAAAAWQNTDVTRPPLTREEMRTTKGGIPFNEGSSGSAGQHGGVITVTGSGDIGRVGIGGITLPIDTDTVKESLIGVRIGLIAVVALGVLFVTSEYKTGTIGTTFAASPRRGQVLAAKAVVLAGTVFVAGLVASFAAFFLAQPFQRRSGFRPPAYPHRSLTDPAVLRAIVGTALLLAVIALFSLGVGAILRRTAGAIIAIFALLIVIPSVASETSIGATTWINRATPIAGLAIQQTMPMPYENVIGPWTGFAVLCGYAAAALGIAFWLLNRRDA
jgi:ABC-type transport system involved in multi-copper enzyme maturation permease subunit